MRTHHSNNLDYKFWFFLIVHKLNFGFFEWLHRSRKQMYTHFPIPKKFFKMLISWCFKRIDDFKELNILDVMDTFKRLTVTFGFWDKKKMNLISLKTDL